ncbi:nucleotidyltransferase family protein [Govanella unica]|uniref:Nucleotidyltransferase family protein n=1 Tax=Govanella unica TaxID=2975056 RepID=A0A9X3TX96_9PROT|nr:nucleotidyltransferase family protein [Govania unica]MDA5193641.1 nucleotidyltransferase family protein [Govania unica]
MAHDFRTLLLAGKRRGIDAVAEARGVSFKAIVPLAGRPMIAWVLDALKDSDYAGPIYISAADPAALRDHVPSLDTVRSIEPSIGSICHSIQKLLADTDLKPPFFLTTADHPLLTPALIDHFLAAAEQQQVDFALGIVPETLFRKAYPTAKRTFIQCRGEGFKSCNMFAFLTPNSLRILDFWANLEQDRKHPLKLARAFGLGNMIRYLLRLDTTDGLISRAGKMLGVTAAAIRMPVPEAAIDVDSIPDLIQVEAILTARSAKDSAA